MKTVKTRPMARKVKLFSLCAMLLASALVIWLTGVTSFGFFVSDVRTRSEANLKVQAAVLEGLLDKFRLMSPLVARSPDSAKIVSMNDADAGRQMAAVSAGMAGAEEVWFLSADGALIASSNATGHTIAAAGRQAIPIAFVQAMQGRLGRELLPGTVSRPASYVFASPVRVDGQTAGVLAVRVSLADVEQAWALSKDPIVAVDENGFVLVSNVAGLRGQNFSDISAAYGALVVAKGERTEDLELTDALPVLGWKVMIFADTTEAQRQSVKAMIIALLLCVIAGGLIWVMLNRKEELTRRLRRDKASALRLERRVRSRTSELRQANTRLEQEVHDRQHAEANLRHTQAELVQAAKLATLGRMSAALSHEYNQPLAAIRSDAEVAEMLIARGTPDLAMVNLGRIGGMVTRMAEIARTLKGFSRRSGTDITPVSLRQVIDEALLLLMPQIKQSAVNLRTSLPEGDIIVRGGKIRLEQVVMNLVSNALDAVKNDATPSIELSLRAEDDFAVLTVADNGSGIDMDVLPQIFDPFFTTKEVGSGLGLGLSIAYKIVHDFSGTLTVSNEQSGGVRFIMRLPVADANSLAAE